MIDLHPTRGEDLPVLARLFESAFGHGLDAAAWEWKYRRLPGEARSLVARDESGAAVAHAGALALPARWRGRDGLLWQLADFAGAARGRGLRPPLVAAGRRLLDDLPRENDLPWIFGFPSRRHFRLGERVFGYRPVREIVPLVGELAAVPELATAPASEAVAERLTVSHRIEVEDDWAAAAWEGCGVDGVRRSAAFLNWRYHDRPDRYYRFYRLAAADGTAGLAVFAFVGREAWAVELWLPPGPGWYDALAATAADLAAAGLETWRFWPPPPVSDLAAVLARLGLAETPDRALLLGCRGRGETPQAGAADAYYSMGDYDAA